jgi:phage shock protein PspC (stress-responsive transcriptional regulator)
MKKVININFQGRVVPIEETAYDALKHYTESLSHFFAKEEGKEEIINDIEGRIAELFAETLKKGSTCISEEDVDRIIKSMGRPEDFETEEMNAFEGEKKSSNNDYQYKNKVTEEHRKRTRLFRDENDKILGGVCGGLANYLRVDASIIRILLVLLGLGGGTGVLIYVLLWVILPSQNLQTNLTKRLYRNGEEKVLGGVASGLAAYFDKPVWIPRLIFCFPLVVAIANSLFHNLFIDFEPFNSFPSFYFGSFGGSLTLIYLVLWAVIPEANTASEKLEMRGDKIDLNSIKSTIQDDLEGFKTRAEKYGTAFGEKAKQWGNDFSNTSSNRSQQFVKEVNAAARTSSGKLGHAIGIVFKAFFLFIAGMLAFALLVLLIHGFFGGVNIVPIKNFFVYSETQNILFWVALICFIIVPIVAFFVWIGRRIIKAKRYSKVISTTFAILWSIGFFAVFALATVVLNNFKTKSAVEEIVNINQPTKNKLYINVAKDNVTYYDKDWYGFDFDRDNATFYGINDDSLFLRNIRVGVFKSKDSLYRIKLIKFCRGKNPQIAQTYAANIDFKINQQDTIITLPNGFVTTKQDKFRNQQIMVVIEVPEGKHIQLSNGIDVYDWFEIEHNRKDWKLGWNKTWNNTLHWDSDEDMIMGKDELKSTHKSIIIHNDTNEDAKDALEEIEQQKRELEQQKKELEQQKKEIIKDAKNQTQNTPKINDIKQVYLGAILLDKFSI